MQLRFDIVDVFTDRPFAGNQLAVVHGADELSAEQCLAVAQEFNFSETTFPSSSVLDGAEYSTSIFTPGGEIPFAGHPTLGTAWVLRSRGLVTAAELTQVCGAGRIPVRFSGNLVELSVVPRDLAGPLPAPLVSALLGDVGLCDDDLVGEAWLAGTGLTFVHLRVTDEAVGRATPSTRPLREYAEELAAAGAMRDPVEGVNLFSVSGRAPDLQVHARVFVPGLSVAEDPATGSSAAGLGVVLVAAGLLPDGGRYLIRQGSEMGRPSLLRGGVETAGGRRPVASVCRVSGQVQHVGRGEMHIPR
jgi:trans-2,3-dihydro-3-hydroxyanthranilate isomerase